MYMVGDWTQTDDLTKYKRNTRPQKERSSNKTKTKKKRWGKSTSENLNACSIIHVRKLQKVGSVHVDVVFSAVLGKLF